MTRSKNLIALMTLAGLTAMSGLSHAQTPAAGTATPAVDQREAKQQARIAQGAGSGSLTAKETQGLEREQALVNKTEAKAKADGTVTPQERRKLHALQDKAGHDIRHAKHNGKVASK